MLKQLWRLAPPVVAVALLSLLSGAAEAAPVTYSTSGVFDAAGTDDDNAGVFLETSTELTTLSFTPQISTGPHALGSTVNLGKFTLEGNGATETFDPGSTFTLTIDQSDPLGGGDTESNIVGSVIYTPANSIDSLGTLTLSFSPDPIEIAGVRYNINPFTIVGNFDEPGGVTGTLKAQISAVPLPAAAWAGIALFGVLGGSKLRRLRRLSRAL